MPMPAGLMFDVRCSDEWFLSSWRLFCVWMFGWLFQGGSSIFSGCAPTMSLRQWVGGRSWEWYKH